MTTGTVSSGLPMPTPEWLREQATVPRVMPAGDIAFVPIAAPLCAMLADAIEIADSCARADIESFCEWNTAGSTRWYDTSEAAIHPADAHPRKAVAQAVRYLEARGDLIRHADKPHLVRFEVAA